MMANDQNQTLPPVGKSDGPTPLRVLKARRGSRCRTCSLGWRGKTQKANPSSLCADNLVFMSELPDERMKLIVTSPALQPGEGIRIENTARRLRRGAGACDSRVRAAPPPQRLHLLAGRQLRGKRGDHPARRGFSIPFFRRRASSSATESSGVSATGSTAPSGSRADTRRSTGGRGETITPGISTRFGFRRSIPARNISSGRTSASSRGTPRKEPERRVDLPEREGATTRKKTIHPCSFPSNSWSVSFSP